MFTGSILLGVLVSFLVQWFKKTFETSTGGTLAAVAIASLVIGAIYAVLQHYNLLPVFITVLGFSQIVYAFFIQHLEK